MENPDKASATVNSLPAALVEPESRVSAAPFSPESLFNVLCKFLGLYWFVYGILTCVEMLCSVFVDQVHQRTACIVMIGAGFFAGLSSGDSVIAQQIPPPQDPAPPLPTQDVENSGHSSRTIDELLLFFPAKHPVGDWAPEDLQYEDVWFSADDGTRLHGWYCESENPRAVVLIAHGNAGNIAIRAAWLRYLQKELRVSALMFDYRGYGRSAGAPTVQGVLADARAARAKLRELAGVQDNQMLLMGESLGGAVVVDLAAESSPKGLILQSTFSSLRDVANFHYPRLSWLVPAAKLDSASQIGRYRGPLIQSHGNADRTIPFASAEKLFREANEPKQFVMLPGADHNNWITDAYLRQLSAFIQRVHSGAE